MHFRCVRPLTQRESHLFHQEFKAFFNLMTSPLKKTFNYLYICFVFILIEVVINSNVLINLVDLQKNCFMLTLNKNLNFWEIFLVTWKVIHVNQQHRSHFPFIYFPQCNIISNFSLPAMRLFFLTCRGLWERSWWILNSTDRAKEHWNDLQ